MKLSIRAKITGGFIAIFVIGMIIGVYGLYSIREISAMSKTQTVIQTESEAISAVLEAHFIWRQNLTIAVLTNTEFTGSYDPSTCALGKWRNGIESKPTTNSTILTLLGQLDTPHNFIHTEAQKVMGMMSEGLHEEAHRSLVESILPSANTAITILSEMTDEYNRMLDEQTLAIDAFQSQALIIIIGIIVAASVICLLLSIFILRSILNPVKALAESADHVANGNFSVNFKYSVNDEIGRLTKNLAILVDTFKTLISDMNKMAKTHSAGEIDYEIDATKYKGEFQDVASGINVMIKEYIDNIQSILAVVQKYAEGDFEAKIAPFPGKKSSANAVLDKVSSNLRNVEDSLMTLVQSATNGELDKRIDDSTFMGDWKDIVSGMNKLLESVDAPLVEAQKTLLLVSEGKLDVKVTGDYKGQFKMMSQSINKTIEVLSTYITEITQTLNTMAEDNFDIEISREYVGNFSNIKIALNAIINRLNNVINEIGMAADNVSGGAVQVSNTSTSLSQGSTEQAASVEQLNASIEEIYTKTLKNSEDSTAAHNLISVVKSDAQMGNAEMKDMLNSMEEINAASVDISKIIKVIEDIAFQTNLLALNAAVEAARAGEHGKGFSVVAEEVRNLAEKSQNSAKETNLLIDRSITCVREGSKIANDTAAALLKMAEGVDSVSEIVSKIEVASKEQAESIAQINESIGHISEVTQETSATSEESAAASEELSSQAEMLKTMTSRFTLKR